jgi:hypothetical protein
MFKPTSSKVVPTDSKRIKVIYNEGKCYNCNGNNLLSLTDDGGSVSQCLDCSINVVLFKYISVEEYKKMFSLDKHTKKDTFTNFINGNKNYTTNIFKSFC